MTSTRYRVDRNHSKTNTPLGMVCDPYPTKETT